MEATRIKAGRARTILGVSKPEFERLVEKGSLTAVIDHIPGRRDKRTFLQDEVNRLAAKIANPAWTTVPVGDGGGDRLVGVTEISLILGISSSKVYALVREGRLPVGRVAPSGQRRFLLRDVRALVGQPIRKKRARLALDR